MWVGATVGACLAMLLGRFVFKKCVEKAADKYPVLKAIVKAIEKEGLKLIILLRLCPLIPFNTLNYVMGVTPVRFKHFAIGNIGMLPGVLVYIFIGTTISDLAEASKAESNYKVLEICLVVVGSIMGCSGIVIISAEAKKQLKLITDSLKDEHIELA